MLQLFPRVPEFAEITEFNESSAAFRINSNVFLHFYLLRIRFATNVQGEDISRVVSYWLIQDQV